MAVDKQRLALNDALSEYDRERSNMFEIKSPQSNKKTSPSSHTNVCDEHQTDCTCTSIVHKFTDNTKPRYRRTSVNAVIDIHEELIIKDEPIWKQEEIKEDLDNLQGIRQVSRQNQNELSMQVCSHTNDFKNEIVIKDELLNDQEILLGENNLYLNIEVMKEDPDLELDTESYIVDVESTTTDNLAQDKIIDSRTDLVAMEVNSDYYSKTKNIDKNDIAQDFKIKTVRDLKLFHNSINIGRKLASNKHEKQNFICDTCNKSFKSRSLIISHLKSHQRYNCGKCNKVFKMSSSLKNHICKRKRSTFQCTHCEKAFKRLDNLQSHILKHTREKPIQCQLCEQEFKEISSLKKHIRIHTGERPYKCSYCDKSFHRSDHLKKHELIHSGLKPYKCDLCERSFSQSGTLLVHKRSHTGEKPYECKICKKAFSKSANMKYHVRTHQKVS